MDGTLFFYRRFRCYAVAFDDDFLYRLILLIFFTGILFLCSQLDDFLQFYGYLLRVLLELLLFTELGCDSRKEFVRNLCVRIHFHFYPFVPKEINEG